MNYTEKDIEAVWNKGHKVPGIDPHIWRKDDCSAWILRSAYGDRDSSYGWEIDHISPGGPTVLHNLRPLQWENNLAKSDGRLVCVVQSDGTKNKNMDVRW